MPDRVANSVEVLASYVPALVRRRLSRAAQVPTAPSEHSFPAVVLFADISGFSRLAEELESEGIAGAERIRDALDHCFGPLLDIISNFGGESLNFAGDAILSIWPRTSESEVTDAIWQALGAAMAIQRELNGRLLAPGTTLQLKLALGCGMAHGLTVGGVERRWEFLITGAPLEQIARLHREAQSGDILLSEEVWSGVREKVLASRMDSGGFRLTDCARIEPSGPAAPESVSPGAQAALRAYVPRALCARIDAGQSQWLAEFRRVTVLFVKVLGVNAVHVAMLDSLQKAALMLQNAVYRFGGSINQFMVDDKGTVMVAGWGLSLHTYEDDAVRAVRAAEEAVKELLSAGYGAAVGVSTGTVFVGGVGNASRTSYALIGKTVNLAAHLMQAANGTILCDGPTRRAAGHKLEFRTSDPVRVKGRSEPVAVFEPIAEFGQEMSSTNRLRLGQLVGRRAQRLALTAAFEQLEENKRGGIYIIEGDPGIGKSALIGELRERAQASPVMCLMVRGDSVDSSAPYAAVRPLLRRLLGVRGRAAGEEQLNRIRQAVGEAHASMAPLLAPVLQFRADPDTEADTLGALSQQGRVDATRQLLVQLIGNLTQNTPLLLILEDAQWLDKASGQLAVALLDALHHVLVVAVTRSAGEVALRNEQPLLSHPSAQYLRLGPLTRDETSVLVCNRLEVDALPAKILDLIWAKAEGHPLFSEQLATALLDQGLIQVRDARCLLREASLNNLTLPSTVQGVITERIDRLSTAQQLTLKSASVLGREFSARWLDAVHPLEPGLERILSELEAITQTGLLRHSGAEGQSFEFIDAISRDVAYGQLPFSQRQKLHARAAAWLEAQFLREGSVDPAQLAHHFEGADDAAKACEYLELCGERALEGSMFQAAREALERALEIAQSDASITMESRRGRWERQLGQAWYGLGRMKEASQHLLRALVLQGFPLRKGRITQGLHLFGLAVSQALHYLVWTRRGAIRKPGADVELTERFREVARTAYWLGAASFHIQDNGTLFYAGLRSLSYAERVGSSAELARGYSFLMYVTGVLGMRGVSRRYAEASLRVAIDIKDPLVEAEVRYNRAGYLMTEGDFAQGVAEVDAALLQYDTAGERTGWRYALALRAYFAYLTGALDEAGRKYKLLRDVAKEADDARNHSVGVCFGASVALRCGRPGDALVLVRELPPQADAATVAVKHGMRALALAHHGEPAQAEREADEGLALFDPAHVFAAPHAFEGYCAIAITYVALGLRSQGKKRDALAGKARDASRALLRFARGCPIAAPSAQLVEGLRDLMRGNTRGARAHWEKSLAIAKRLAMPYDQASAHYLLAESAGLIGEARAFHQTRVSELSRELGLGASQSLLLPRLFKS
ncbi:MAG: AAA family ATPase [Polyangiaceae bacterium]|nr:AAA family ATPase [Polyangiaceae bacterium]